MQSEIDRGPQFTEIVNRAYADLEALWPRRVSLVSPEGSLAQFGQIEHGLPSKGIPLTRLQLEGLEQVTLDRLRVAGVHTLQELESSRLSRLGRSESDAAHFGEADRRQIEMLETAGYLCLEQISQNVKLEMRAGKKLLCPDLNIAVVDPELLMSLDRLVSGKDRIGVRSFFNLCALTECVVLNESLVAPFTKSEVIEVEHSLDGLMKWDQLPSEHWGDSLLTDQLRAASVIRVSSRENPYDEDLRAGSEDLVSHYVIQGKRLGEGVTDTESVAVIWAYLLRSRLAGLDAQDTSVLSAIQMFGPMSYRVGRNWAEARRRNWNLCSDLAFQPLYWAPATPGSKAREILTALDARYRSEVRRFYVTSDARVIEIPMLTAILLSRAKKRENIPGEMLKLREEFGGLRSALTKYAARLRDCETLADFRDVSNDLRMAWDRLLKRIDRRQTRLVRRVYDVIKASGMKGVLKATIEQLLDLVEERVTLGKLNDFTNLWEEASAISDYELLVERTFGDGLSGKDWDKFSALRQKLESLEAKPEQMFS